MSEATLPRPALEAERSPSAPAPGPALVISLDFELHWGVRDVHGPSSGYIRSIRGAREAIPRLLDLFARYEVAATWATVGFLFAESRDELESFHPAVRPRYRDPRLDPYAEPVGEGERDDPLHFAPSLIRTIADAPRQEIATHTYSHFYCLEADDVDEPFRHDLASAVAIARARGIELRSIVLPRNQWRPRLAPAIAGAGLLCYRGNQPGAMYRPMPGRSETRWDRLRRLADAHLPVSSWSGTPWRSVPADAGLADIRATCFVRPVGSGPRSASDLRLRRITRSMGAAAAAGRIFHLWWHPHNCGLRTAENLDFLRRILDHFGILRDRHGMTSLSMLGAWERAQRGRGALGGLAHG